MSTVVRSLTWLTLVFLTPEIFAQELRDFDAGFLIGLRSSLAAVSPFNSGRGDIDYHHGTFHFRKAIATQLAQGIEKEAVGLPNSLLKTTLFQIATDLRGASKAGRGDLDYWIQMLSVQRDILSSVIRRQRELAEQLVPESTVTRAREGGYLRGLRVGVHGLLSSWIDRGDIDFWMRLFDLQRDAANAVARAIESDLAHQTNPFLSFTLRELAKDIASAPQKGYGDLDYWSGDVRTHQRGVLGRVVDKFDALAKFLEVEAPGCSSLFENDGEPKTLSLKDI